MMSSYYIAPENFKTHFVNYLSIYNCSINCSLRVHLLALGSKVSTRKSHFSMTKTEMNGVEEIKTIKKTQLSIDMWYKKCLIFSDAG